MESSEEARKRGNKHKRNDTKRDENGKTEKKEELERRKTIRSNTKMVSKCRVGTWVNRKERENRKTIESENRRLENQIRTRKVREKKSYKAE